MKRSPLNLSHQTHIIDQLFIRPMTLIGGGSVGSWVGVLAAKSGVVDLTIYDDDYVASHNIPMSAYGIEDIGRPKVLALESRILRDSGVNIVAYQEKYFDTQLSGTVVACVDSMLSRECIWDAVKGNPRVDLLCETRTHAAYIEVYVIDPHNREDVADYEATFYSDGEAVRQSCGQHGVAYATVAAASAVVSQMTQFWQTRSKKRWHAERRDHLIQVN